MTTATAGPTQPADIDAMISRTVRAIISYQGGDARDRVVRALGVKRSAFYGRLAGDTQWTAKDVKRTADALGVNVAVLYEGLQVTATLTGDMLGLAA